MKVSVKDFAVQMELLNNGMELEIRDNSGNHLGDMFISKSGLEWCAGRTRKGNGSKKKWEKVISSFDE